MEYKFRVIEKKISDNEIYYIPQIGLNTESIYKRLQMEIPKNEPKIDWRPFYKRSFGNTFSAFPYVIRSDNFDMRDRNSIETFDTLDEAKQMILDYKIHKIKSDHEKSNFISDTTDNERIIEIG